jgi:uncharacterized membrane protein
MSPTPPHQSFHSPSTQLQLAEREWLQKYTDLKLEHIAELSAVKERELATALDLRNQEINRRLLDLNNENQRIEKIQNTCVNRDIYDGAMQRMLDKIDLLNTWKATQEGKASQTSVVWALVFSAGSLILGIVSVIEAMTK